ncbi:prefoldin, alpha subunit [Batrachochytrium salamandrivorans]|nr:prefoldin, alpha subunit [Batrachochytrium salamandrivorans]
MSQAIKLEDLPVQQLQAVRQQLEEEIQMLTQSFTQLKQAQAKFSQCVESLKPLAEPKNEAKAILIGASPLVRLLRVLSDIHKVIVDVGTGYLVEKSVEDATDFYKRKVEFLKTNLLGLQDTVVQRRNQRASVINMIEAKVSMMKKGPEMAPTSAVAQ